MGPDTGDPREWKSMDDVYEAYRKQYNHCFKLGWLMRNVCHEMEARYYQQPFLSACFEPFIEKGKDCMEHDELPVPWYTVIGLVDTGDSLAAMKYWIFEGRDGEGKKYTMDQLLDALSLNWEGYEEMRLDFLNAPKWGNDDDYADMETKKAFDIALEEGLKFTDRWGAHPRPLPETLTSLRLLGYEAPAMPNGRHAADVLYDGGTSPGYGCDKKGPTAVLKSCSKLDYTEAKGCLLNQRFSPASIEGDKGKHVFLSYMKAWHDLGIQHVQINVVDSDVLRDAQKQPDKYTDLIVRVAGYSAYFIELDKETQDSIIARTEQQVGVES
jgi:formate C-acetyltransferase/benzylsuccinate synthase